MGIKTTVNYKGIFSERADSDSFHLDVKSHKDVQNFAAGSGGAITKSVAVLEASVAGVTASLPDISSENVGLEVVVINANLTQDLMVSASNPIDFGTFTFVVPEESGTFLAISSSAGYGWVVTHLKA